MFCWAGDFDHWAYLGPLLIIWIFFRRQHIVDDITKRDAQILFSSRESQVGTSSLDVALVLSWLFSVILSSTMPIACNGLMWAAFSQLVLFVEMGSPPTSTSLSIYSADRKKILLIAERFHCNCVAVYICQNVCVVGFGWLCCLFQSGPLVPCI